VWEVELHSAVDAWFIDKAGNWKRWYDQNIPVAEARYEEYLRDLIAEES
jgi:hypothetical protein